MAGNTELLENLSALRKLYEGLCAPVRGAHDLTQTEVDVAAFLGNNPHMDTASHIVELRMLPKANVSLAVDALIRKGLANRQPDENDRRRIHIKLTPQGQALLPKLREIQLAYEQILFQDFSLEERRVYGEMSGRIWQNARRGWNKGRMDEERLGEEKLDEDRIDKRRTDEG